MGIRRRRGDGGTDADTRSDGRERGRVYIRGIWEEEEDADAAALLLLQREVRLRAITDIGGRLCVNLLCRGWEIRVWSWVSGLVT